ncbi:MAG: hypothetical protein IPK50_14675 [Fibrobacterota bacterium]|nr:MAG: hypothetical protein IPK50_14675 [Fibrobacterota bacterium]
MQSRSWWMVVALGAVSVFAGLSGEVRVASGEGLSGVSIALRGRTELTTTSGVGGRWTLGSSALRTRTPIQVLPSNNLFLREGRLVVSWGGFSLDGANVAVPGQASSLPSMASRSAAAIDTLVFSLCSAKAILPVGSMDSGSIVVVLDTAGASRGCDASQPSIPTLGFPTSFGNVTTYGGVDSSLKSAGGACNYGATGIRFYAAIQVNLQGGDAAGQWRDGRACGQGARVRAYTPQGIKETYVRIMDKCPDPHCGIDLGGAPARAIMGVQAGRYQGEWTLVSAKGHPELFDGPTHLWTKEGTSRFWSLVQVRNPWTAVAALRWKSATAPAGEWSDMPWATEAENFFKVPTSLLSGADSVDILVRYVDSTEQAIRLAPTDLAREKASYELTP